VVIDEAQNRKNQRNKRKSGEDPPIEVIEVGTVIINIGEIVRKAVKRRKKVLLKRKRRNIIVVARRTSMRANIVVVLKIDSVEGRWSPLN
jgi:hypothetical protein